MPGSITGGTAVSGERLHHLLHTYSTTHEAHFPIGMIRLSLRQFGAVEIAAFEEGKGKVKYPCVHRVEGELFSTLRRGAGDPGRPAFPGSFGDFDTLHYYPRSALRTSYAGARNAIRHSEIIRRRSVRRLYLPARQERFRQLLISTAEYNFV